MKDDAPQHYLESQGRLTRWRDRLAFQIEGGRRRLLWVVIAVLIVGTIVWIARPSPQQQGPGGRFGMNMPMPVALATAARGDVPIIFSELGTVTPLATITVQTQISGQLVEVRFKEGQAVQKGDVLAVIDPRPYQAALDQAKGTLAHDQAYLDNAIVDQHRYETLVKQNSIAEQQLATQVALVKQYQGTVETDKAAVQNAELNLQYCYIHSPVTGRVGLRLVDQGNYIEVGSSPTGIAVVTQEQPMSVIFTVPEDKVGQVMARVHQNAVLPVTAYDHSGATKLAVGTLTNVDNQIDPTTGMVKMRAQFENKDETLFPNQFVNVSLLVDTMHDAVVVPVSAVQHGAPGAFAYLVNKSDSTVSVRPVTEGPSTSDTVAVLSGLQPGEAVVTDGADRLKDGAKVILPGQMPPQGPGQAGQRRGPAESGFQGSGGGQKGAGGQGGQRQGGAPQ
jgi:multidrug efflux system membrane fusion protein